MGKGSLPDSRLGYPGYNVVYTESLKRVKVRQWPVVDWPLFCDGRAELPVYDGPTEIGVAVPSCQGNSAGISTPGISMPLKRREWLRCLRQHPDREFSQYIQQGLVEGIGYNYSRSAHRSSTQNMLSVGQNPEVVDQ